LRFSLGALDFINAPPLLSAGADFFCPDLNARCSSSAPRFQAMFDSKTRTVVVVGAQWGDEGKGKLVDVMAERADWVVRYQGGANAGHTVDIGARSFVLHQVPSGILHPGVRCAIGNGVVLDPETLFAEMDEMVRDGVDVEGRLYVSDRAHLVMPYHKLVDGESEASKAIGTTGRGIGPAYEDKVGRRGVRVTDLRHPARLRQLVESGVEHANAQLHSFNSNRRADVEEIMARMQAIAPRLLALSDDVGLVIHRARQSGAAVLLEGAQGSLLDVDHGTYPFVTSSNTTVGGAFIGAGLAPNGQHSALGVVKAYTTRVGNGPLPTEFDEELGARVRKLGNEFGATTGRPRRCGWFDAVVVRYAVRVNGLTHLAVTKLDVLDTLERIGLCTGYRVRGEHISEFPADIAALDGVEPEYEWFDGWMSSTGTARRLEDLPATARRYLDRIQELSEAPIRYVSVGTRRDQIIGT
jgi:adenylosuccinate synthase